MTNQSRVAWIEAAASVITAALAVLTAITPDWVEAASGVDPDVGSSELEWTLTLAFAGCAVICALMARAQLGHVTSTEAER